MSVRTRKFIGTIVLLVFLAIYAMVAMALGASQIVIESKYAQGIYFLIAGLLWVLPAGLLIRWMQKPNKVSD